MPLDLKPHKYKTNPQTGMATLDKVIPYKLFTRMEPGGRVEIYLQNGTYYYESGEIVPDEMLKRVGLTKDFGPDGTEIPKSMDEHPKMKEIMEAEKFEMAKAKARPTKTVVVESPKPASAVKKGK